MLVVHYDADLSCLPMFRAYFHTVANKKRMTSVVEKIGFSAAQANILNVLGEYLFACC